MINAHQQNKNLFPFILLQCVRREFAVWVTKFQTMAVSVSQNSEENYPRETKKYFTDKKVAGS